MRKTQKMQKLQRQIKNSLKGSEKNKTDDSNAKASNKKSKAKATCQVCGKNLRSKYHLKIHMAVHTGEKNYICGICKKGYQQKWNLITHVARVHSKEKPFKCNDCGKAFGYSSHFKRHVKTHFLEKIQASDAVKKIILNPHKCKYCEKSFESNYRLDLHLRIHTGTRPYVCDKCGKSFTTKRLCAGHLKKKHDEDKFVCEHCGETFSDRKTIFWHLRTGHNIVGPPAHETKEIEEVKKQLIPCEVCGKSVTRGSVKKHLNIHYRNRVYSCRFCEKEFLESGQRMVHERKHTGEKPYKCDICGKGHTQYGNLLAHRKRYHNLSVKTPQLWKRNGRREKSDIITNKQSKCLVSVEDNGTTEDNSEKIWKPENVNVLQTQYTGNETIEEFLKKASTWANEKFQESKHNRGGDNAMENPDSPEVAPVTENYSEDSEEVTTVAREEMKKKINKIIFEKIVDDISMKENHLVKIAQESSDPLREFLKKLKVIPDNIVMRKKDGKLFWHCWLCTSALRSRHLLARHLIIHEPEENRPYRCEVCQKTFTQSNNYKEHVMTHLNENQYYCEICGSGFRHKSHFNTHMKRHNPTTQNPIPKKYQCSFCDKKMHTNYQKIEHERTHTRERPFLCKVCGQQFGTSSTLRRHHFIHFSPSHQCTICLKLFKQKCSLKRHYQTHSKHPSDRVTCQCGKSLNKNASLKKHKMICKARQEPVEKPFSCCICEKKFVTKSNLKRHVATHDSSKRFVCPVCETRLKSDETFKRHMRRHDDIRNREKKLDTVA